MVTLTDRIVTSSPLSNYSESSNGGTSDKDRPDFSRKNTSSSFLDYYTSPIPDAHAQKLASARALQETSHTRQLSSGSESSDSQYSSASGLEQATDATATSPEKRRKGSRGAGDRRRLQIVEMQSRSEDQRVPGTASDNGQEKNPPPRSSVRVRRNAEAKLHGLAIVAPPDATPSSYRNLTAAGPPLATLESLKSWDLSSSPHQRASSEATVMNGRVGGVSGILPQIPTLDFIEHSRPPAQRGHTAKQMADNIASLATKSATSSVISTPEIGQEKAISVPVAPPVIVQITSSSPTRNQSSPSKHAQTYSVPLTSAVEKPPRPMGPRNDYLDYQPGLHATAGRLPPPPEPSTLLPVLPSFSQPPPRPPRLRSPSLNPNRDMTTVKQSLQLPASVTTKLSTPSSSPQKEPVSPTTARPLTRSPSPTTAKPSTPSPSPTTAKPSTPSTSPQELPSSIPEQASVTHDHASHKREAGFSPSVFMLQQKLAPSPIPSSQPSPDKPPALVDPLLAGVGEVVEEMKIVDDDRVERSTLESDERSKDSHRPQRRRNASQVELAPSLSRHDRRSEDGRSRTPSIAPSVRTPSPPAKSVRHLAPKAALKRDATLPKIPSHAPSVKTTFSDLHSSYTPSPPHSPKSRSQHRRIICMNPVAMICTDVVTRKTSQERSIGYAQKINELYLYDCGLGDWLTDIRLRGRSQEHLPSRAPLSPLSQNRSLGIQRQPSRSSLISGISEITFPTRPDASVATDLSKVPSRELSLAPTQPAVPYPSLIPAARVLSSRSSIISAASSARAPAYPANKAAAFFASLGRTSSTKKEKVVIGASSPLNKSKPLNMPPKPVQIQSSPHVPGGPRALPSKQRRSQTIMISPPLQINDNRSSAMTRRPSLFTPTIDKPDVDPSFSEQVDKLQDLLPHVDRTILAGYLRRSGHDMLAIGQYLEDEKNGTIKAH